MFRESFIIFGIMILFTVSWFIFVNLYYNVLKPHLIDYFYNRLGDKWVSPAYDVYSKVEDIITYFVPLMLGILFLIILAVISQKQPESKLYRYRYQY